MTDERETQQKKIDHLGATPVDNKLDKNLIPFLKLLIKHKLIDYKNPRYTDWDLHIRMQNCVYIAKYHYGLEFDYSHEFTHWYGPWSAVLQFEYEEAQNNIDDESSEELENWTQREEFLDFVTKHNDVCWLTLACFILYMHNSERTDTHKLIEQQIRLTDKFASKYEDVHQELVQNKFSGMPDEGSAVRDCSICKIWLS